jgi:hypothetical protein
MKDDKERNYRRSDGEEEGKMKRRRNRKTRRNRK